jgi:hypothetical protein
MEDAKSQFYKYALIKYGDLIPSMASSLSNSEWGDIQQLFHLLDLDGMAWDASKQGLYDPSSICEPLYSVRNEYIHQCFSPSAISHTFPNLKSANNLSKVKCGLVEDPKVLMAFQYSELNSYFTYSIYSNTTPKLFQKVQV